MQFEQFPSAALYWNAETQIGAAAFGVGHADQANRIRTTTMTTYTSASAKIYAFPPRGRFLETNAPETVAPLASWQQPVIASGSGWYHEEAIAQARAAERRQAEPRRNN